MSRLGVFALFPLFLAGCEDTVPPSFDLVVTPTGIRDTIPDQKCVLLARIVAQPPQSQWGAVATISAQAPGAQVSVANAQLGPNDVAEVTVAPARLATEAEQFGPPDDGGDEGRDIEATVTAELGGATRSVVVPIHVTSEETDGRAADAAPVRDLWVSWLAENQPGLGITEDTVWTGTIVRPHWLVVPHYLYFSDEWEMRVYWHEMIPPYDWAKVDLRRRFLETKPSLAFQMPSRSAGPVDVSAITPEEGLVR